MNYLVIDLEMCRVQKLYKRDYKYASEIIQIGAVLLDENYSRIATLSQYVHPEYGVLDNFIESMTGIRNYDIKNAPLLWESLEHLIDWIGNREYKIFAWRDSDYKQILHELKVKHIDSERIKDFMNSERWIDYQDVFKKRFNLGRQFSLKEALERAEVEPEGHFHDGLDDAVNTGKLIQKLEKNPEYQLFDYATFDSDEPLNCTIGDLLGNLLINVG